MSFFGFGKKESEKQKDESVVQPTDTPSQDVAVSQPAVDVPLPDATEIQQNSESITPAPEQSRPTEESVNPVAGSDSLSDQSEVTNSLNVDAVSFGNEITDPAADTTPQTAVDSEATPAVETAGPVSPNMEAWNQSTNPVVENDEVQGVQVEEETTDSTTPPAPMQ